MSNITPNVEAQVEVDKLNRYEQDAFSLGNAVFTYRGPFTPQFSQLCTDYRTRLEAMIPVIPEILKDIPTS